MEGSHHWAELEAALKIFNGTEKKNDVNTIADRPAQALLYDAHGNPLPGLEPGEAADVPRFGQLALVPDDALDSTGDRIKPKGEPSRFGSSSSGPVARPVDGPQFTYRDAFGNVLTREQVHRMSDLKGRPLVLPYGS